MSLRWRIMGSIVFVIVLTVLISVGVGYFATQSRLGVFVDEIGDDEARLLAQNLSREYTSAGSWETVARPLSDAGFLYDGVERRERSEGGEDHGEERLELFHEDPVRVVIADVEGLVVTDNLSELSIGSPKPDLAGHRETVFDLITNRPVGHVYVDVNRELLTAESHRLLNTLLFITVIGGILTVGVAVLLAVWLSKRITAPVTALTDATRSIAQGDATLLPVTSSDELGQMSAAFNQMTTDLENQREIRRQLINDISHELNTPLSVIHLEAKGLQDGLQTPERASAHIVEETQRLRGLAGDLNWIAESDRGEMRLSLETVSVHEMLAGEAERWQPQAQVRQIEVSTQISDDYLVMELDGMRMSQALGNVLNNAIRCTEPGGYVLVKAELESDEALAISIIDDGIGMDAADLPYVFDRFYRTEESRIRGIGGTGLGLSITQSIVEAHGGSTAVASDGIGQGVCVTVRLPVNAGPA